MRPCSPAMKPPSMSVAPATETVGLANMTSFLDWHEPIAPAIVTDAPPGGGTAQQEPGVPGLPGLVQEAAAGEGLRATRTSAARSPTRVRAARASSRASASRLGSLTVQASRCSPVTIHRFGTPNSPGSPNSARPGTSRTLCEPRTPTMSMNRTVHEPRRLGEEHAEQSVPDHPWIRGRRHRGKARARRRIRGWHAPDRPDAAAGQGAPSEATTTADHRRAARRAAQEAPTRHPGTASGGSARGGVTQRLEGTGPRNDLVQHPE